MPKVVPPLTDLQIRNARPKDAPYKMFDGGGLYLEVTPAGGKLWKLKYRNPQGRENKLSLGAYPEVTLQAARERRLQVRRQLAEGRDPAAERKAALRAMRQAADDSFEAVARAWHANTREQWQPRTADNILHRFEVDIFPEIGRMRIREVRPRDVLAAVRKIEERGALEVAKRITADVSRVFVYAFHSSLVDGNPAASLNKVLKPRVKGHFASIDSERLGEFVEALARNEACMGPVVRIAMRLMMLVFVRTSELIETPWDEIRFGEPWIIPWQRMKRGKRKVNPDKTNHYVCLPRQGWALLEELRTYTGGGRWLFPNMWDPARPMSNNAILKALERMGYKGEMTGHGFRSLAMSTLKQELHFRHEVVDRQLAHAPKDKLETAYDRARYLKERQVMMQRWADYLEKIEREALARPRGGIGRGS